MILATTRAEMAFAASRCVLNFQWADSSTGDHTEYCSWRFVGGGS
eukprot:COSAG02_NODE_4556_length_5219_cov_3.546094_5_plen_45_part_00